MFEAHVAPQCSCYIQHFVSWSLQVCDGNRQPRRQFATDPIRSSRLDVCFTIPKHSYDLIDGSADHIARDGIVNRIIDFVCDLLPDKVCHNAPVDNIGQCTTNEFTAILIHLECPLLRKAVGLENF